MAENVVFFLWRHKKTDTHTYTDTQTELYILDMWWFGLAGNDADVRWLGLVRTDSDTDII